MNIFGKKSVKLVKKETGAYLDYLKSCRQHTDFLSDNCNLHINKWKISGCPKLLSVIMTLERDRLVKMAKK